MSTPRTVLVVEDNPITRKMMGVVLRGEGYRVLEAPDGRTAIEQMASGGPDLIVQDLLLPDLDGFELARRLRQMPGGEQIAIIAVSGLSLALERIRTGPEFNDFVMKPVEPSRLTQIVRAFLPSQQSPPDGSVTLRRMVLIDDDTVQRKLATLRFGELGFTVTTAADGVEGLDAIRRVKPDIVVSDVLMGRMDGFELCRTLRRDPVFARLPIILVTSTYVEEEDRRFARRVGAHDLVVRTPDMKTLIDTVSATLSGELRPEPPQTGSGEVAEHIERLVHQLERQVDSNATLGLRCALQAAELAMLAGTSQVLARIDRVEDMLNEILVRCLDAAGLARGAILLRDEQGRLRVQAQVGYDPGEWLAIEPNVVASRLVQEAATSEEPIAVRLDRVTDDAAQEFLHSTKATSTALASVTSGRESLGVLVLLASGEGDLTEDNWVWFSQAAAAQLGHAIGLGRAFAMLTASESRYRLLFEANPYPALVFDPETLRFLAVNDAAVEHYGYSRDEFLAMTILDILPPEDIPRALAALVESDRAHSGEWRHRKKDGTIIDVEIKRQAVDMAGRSARMVLARDITDLKRAAEEKEGLEAQLHESEERMRLIVSHALDAVVTIDADGRITSWNPQAERLFGWSQDEIRGRLLSETIIPPASREAHERGLRHFRATGEGPVLNRRIELTALHRNGTEFPVELAITPLRVGGAVAFSAFLRDITEQKRAEASLATFTERLKILHEIDRALLAAEAPVAIAETILPRLRDLLGVPRAIVNLFDLASGQAEWLAAAGRRRVRLGPGVRFPLALMGDVDALRRGELQVIDVNALPRSPEAEALLASGVYTYMVVPMIAGGELIGGLSFGGASAEFLPEQVSIAREVAAQLAIALEQARLREHVKRHTEELEQRVAERMLELSTANGQLQQEIVERQRAQEALEDKSRALEEAQGELLRTERLAILGQLAGGVSHELRNPLGVIKNSIYFLRMVLGDDAKVAKHLAILEREIATSNRIVTGLLDFARVTPPTRLDVDLSRLVQDYLAQKPTPGGVTVVLQLSEGLAPVSADPDQLTLVLGNLVTNAVQAMPEGGTLTITTAADGGGALLDVADTGTGIAPENLGKVFEPLFTTKPRGIGLGLAIAKSLGEANGARLTAASAPGQGSRFGLHFAPRDHGDRT